MNLIDENYLSDSYSDIHRSMGFPALFYKSTVTRDSFNQVSVSLTPANAVVYAVAASEALRDADLTSKASGQAGDIEMRNVIKIVRRDLIAVGINKLEMRDVVDLTINGETLRYTITGFSDKNELPNIFFRLILSLMTDVNVGVEP